MPIAVRGLSKLDRRVASFSGCLSIFKITSLLRFGRKSDFDELFRKFPPRLILTELTKSEFLKWEEAVPTNSFNAAIEYGKLAITLVASLGAGAGFSLLAFIGTRSSDQLEAIGQSTGSLRLIAYCFVASAALPPASAALSYCSQVIYTTKGENHGNSLRVAAVIAWIGGLASFVIGSIMALQTVIR